MGEVGDKAKGGGCERVDKWLWATRMFKTRTQAAAACRRCQVKVEEAEVKPSRILKVGDSLKVTREELTRTVKVVGVPHTRVSAKSIGEYLEEHTTEEEIERAKEMRARKAANKVFRMPGEGRPTKKQLREIQKYIEAERGEA